MNPEKDEVEWKIFAIPLKFFCEGSLMMKEKLKRLVIKFFSHFYKTFEWPQFLFFYRKPIKILHKTFKGPLCPFFKFVSPKTSKISLKRSFLETIIWSQGVHTIEGGEWKWDYETLSALRVMPLGVKQIVIYIFISCVEPRMPLKCH